MGKQGRGGAGESVGRLGRLGCRASDEGVARVDQSSVAAPSRRPADLATDRPPIIPSPAPFPHPRAYLAAVLMGSRAWDGLPPAFAVVTAWNPGGRMLPEEENIARGEALARRVRGLGWEHFDVTGASPDLAHREPGLGVVSPSLADAAALSAEFGQRAFFWVEGGRIWVCDDASGSGWPAGTLGERYRHG